jgi:hypothetical protein
MFLPDKTSRLAWISKASRGTGQRAADSEQPQRSTSPRGAETQHSGRSMALSVGLAILLLVLALVALAMSSPAGAHAVVAAPGLSQHINSDTSRDRSRHSSATPANWHEWSPGNASMKGLVKSTETLYAVCRSISSLEYRLVGPSPRRLRGGLYALDISRALLRVPGNG